MNHKITLTCAPPGPDTWRVRSDTWRVRLDDRDLITFNGPRAYELAEQSRRNLEYFLESTVSDLHDTAKHE